MAIFALMVFILHIISSYIAIDILRYLQKKDPKMYKQYNKHDIELGTIYLPGMTWSGTFFRDIAYSNKVEIDVTTRKKINKLRFTVYSIHVMVIAILLVFTVNYY